eukprot:SAG31_NODE_4778_length_2959_cov_17.543706_3_plen_156_part_00
MNIHNLQAGCTCSDIRPRDELIADSAIVAGANMLLLWKTPVLRQHISKKTLHFFAHLGKPVPICDGSNEVGGTAGHILGSQFILPCLCDTGHTSFQRFLTSNMHRDRGMDVSTIFPYLCLNIQYSSPLLCRTFSEGWAVRQWRPAYASPICAPHS